MPFRFLEAWQKFILRGEGYKGPSSNSIAPMNSSLSKGGSFERSFRRKGIPTNKNSSQGTGMWIWQPLEAGENNFFPYFEADSVAFIEGAGKFSTMRGEDLSPGLTSEDSRGTEE